MLFHFHLFKNAGTSLDSIMKVKARNPEMSSTKKGNDWYFGMKARIGVDVDSGVTHSLETSTAKVHDSQVWDDLLHDEVNALGLIPVSASDEFWPVEKFPQAWSAKIAQWRNSDGRPLTATSTLI